MLSLVAWGSLIAWPPLLLITLIVEGPQKIINSFYHLNWISIAAILYIVYPTTLFGFGAWSWLLSRYPVTTIAPFTLLVPVFGMLSSALILGEPLQSWKIIASLLVIGGLSINLLWTRFVVSKRLTQS